MYEGLDFQRMMFERLFITTKQTLLENGGYIKPIVEVFWHDGRRSEIAMNEEDCNMLSDTGCRMVAQFLADLDLFCSKQDVYVVYACFPLDMPHYYCCVLTGLEWHGYGLCRAIYFDKSAMTISEVDHDLSKYERIFEEVRFKALFHDNPNTGRA